MNSLSAMIIVFWIAIVLGQIRSVELIERS
jgi:hypothetical protein